MTVYQSPAMEPWLRQRFQASGKKLDMDLVGEAIGRVFLADYIINYEDVLKLEHFSVTVERFLTVAPPLLSCVSPRFGAARVSELSSTPILKML